MDIFNSVSSSSRLRDDEFKACVFCLKIILSSREILVALLDSLAVHFLEVYFLLIPS